MIHPVILCGGSGTRMWPLSRSYFPKQFHSIQGNRTLLEDTILRIDGLTDVGTCLAICNEQFQFMTQDQFADMDHENFKLLIEPCARNTAPAIAVAAKWIIDNFGSGLMLVMPADHVVKDVKVFLNAVTEARAHANEGNLITFGVTPDSAETGYGYIKAGSKIENSIVEVDQFVEKPDLETAKHFLASGDYFWNSGIFLFDCQAWLSALEQYAPEIYSNSLLAIENAVDSDFGLLLDQHHFDLCPSDSIDYAVMEHASNVSMMPLDANWQDVGSWKGAWKVSEHDDDGNAQRGDVYLNDVKNSYVHSDGRLVVVSKLSNVAVIDTKDVTYITDIDESQEVKSVVSALKKQQRVELDFHRRVYRPWGSFEGIDSGPGFQVKRLSLNPKAEISLQYHHKRSEHWVVVAGTALVQKGEKVFELNINESVDIPVGTKHKLSNPYNQTLEIIEVQTGSYLGEDDIVRIEDKYGRIKEEHS